jgi:hypothetical protein
MRLQAWVRFGVEEETARLGEVRVGKGLRAWVRMGWKKR